MESAQMAQRNSERGRGRGDSREGRIDSGGSRGGRGFGERGIRGRRGMRGERGSRGGCGVRGEHGFRGRGFDGERGSRGGRGFGRGGERGAWEVSVVLRKCKYAKRLVRGEYKEHPDYPGWGADELFWILERKSKYINRFYWCMVSRAIPGRSTKDCTDLWQKITNSLEPITCKTAIDYVKKSLFFRTIWLKRDEIEDLPKKPVINLINCCAVKENLTQMSVDEQSSYWKALNNSKKAEYYKSKTDLRLEYYLACFDYFKEHPEEYDKITTSD